MLVWSNRPILLLMFKAGFQPVICNALRFLAFFVCVHCLFQLFICIANPAYNKLETGLYTASLLGSIVGRSGRACQSVRHKLSIWSRVGRSVRLLGNVTRPITPSNGGVTSVVRATPRVNGRWQSYPSHYAHTP